jgi:hypothetical protein
MSILGIEAWPQMGIGKKARYFVICVPRFNGPLWPPNLNLGKLLKTNWLLNSLFITFLKEDHMGPCKKVLKLVRFVFLKKEPTMFKKEPLMLLS